MGGSGIFRITADGLNLGAVLETLSPNESRLVMAQEYRPEIVDGDSARSLSARQTDTARSRTDPIPGRNAW